VAVTEVQARDIARSVTVTGPVEPIRTVSVSAQTAGTLLTVLLEEGDRVKAGQLMAELDSREVSAQLERARAVLANAESAFDRAKGLRASDLTSEADLDATRSTYEIARADVELWSTRLAFCRIAAPVAGVVTRKYVEKGSTVSSGGTLFEIADDTALVVRVRVSELDVVQLAPGLAVTLQLDAYPGREIGGHIRRIFPAADASSRLIPVEVELDPRPAGVRARPGFLARVSFALDRRDDVLAVPAAALGSSDAGSFVYVVQADTLVRRSVETGLTASGWIEVTRGLATGEEVVSSGHVNLSPGVTVRVTAAEGRGGGTDSMGATSR
jgi:RND family efflux transporter MFP subunit